MAFLQRLSDGEATGPEMVGRVEFGTSPADCVGDSWESPVPAASGGQLSPPGFSLCLDILLFAGNDVAK